MRCSQMHSLHFLTQDLSNLDATICRDFLRHVCKRGRKCKFKHPSQEECDRLRADRGEVVFCHDYQNGACRRPACKFLHVTKEEEEVYRLSGSLPSNLCSSHSTEKSSDLKVPLCKDYLNHNCHRGATCKFRHLKAQPSDQPPPAPVPPIPPPSHVPVTSQNFAYVDFPLTTQSSPVNGHVYLPQTVNYTVRTSQPCSAACAVTSTLPTTVSTSTFLLPPQQSYRYAQLPVSAVPSDIITSSVSSDILLPISQTVIVAPSVIEHVGSQGEFTQPQHHHHHHQQHPSILSAPHTAFSVLQKQQQQPSSQQPQAHPPNGVHLTSQATQLGTVQTITLASDPHKAFTQHLYAQIPAVANPTSCSAVAAHHLTVRSAVAPHSLSTSTATAIVGTPVIPASSVYLQQQQPQQQHQPPECLLAPSSAAATALAAHSSPALVNSHPASHEMPHASQLMSLVESGTTLMQTDRQQQQPLSSSSALHFAPHSAVAALPVSAQPPPPSAVRPVAGNSVSLILHPTSEVTPLPTRIVSLPTMAAASPAVSATATFTTASVDSTGLSTIPLSVLAPVMPACSTTTFQPAALLHAASDAPTGHTFLGPGSGTFHTFVSNAACQMTVNHSGAGQHMTLSIPVSSEAYVPTATVTNTPSSHSSSPTVELPPTTTSPTVVCHSTTLDQQKQQEANTAAAFAAAACFGAAAAAATRVAAVANSSVASSGFINSASSLTAGLSHHSASTSAAVAAAAAAAVAAVVSAPSSSSVSTRLSLPPPPLSVSRSFGLADCDTPATEMTVKNETAAPSPSFSSTSTETTEQKLGPDTMGNPGSPSRSCPQRPWRSIKVSSRSRQQKVAADTRRLQISHSADSGDANPPLAAATTKATPGLLDAATVGGLMLHQAGDQGSAATPPPPPSSSTSQQCAALMSFNSATYTMTTAAAAAAAVVAAAAVEHQQQQQQQEQKRVAAALANVAGTSATCSQLDHVTLLSDHGLRLDQTSPASQSTASSSLPSPTTTFCLKEPPPSKVSSHSHSSLQRCFKQRHKRPTAHQLGVSETALVYGGTDVMNSMSAFAQRLMVSANRRSRKTFHDQRGLRRYMGRDISVNETEEDEDDEEEEEDFEDMVDFDDDEVVGEETQLSPRFGRSSGLSAEDAVSLTREDLYEQYASSRTGRHLGDEQEGSVISRDPRDPTVYLFQSKRSRPSAVESTTPDYRSSHSFNRDDKSFDSPPPFTKQGLECNSSTLERRKSTDLADEQIGNSRGRPRSLDRCFGCRPLLGLGSRRRCFSFSACDSPRRSKLPEKSNYRQELPECQPKDFSKVDLSELSPLTQNPGPCGQPSVFPTVSHSDISQTPASALVVETHKTSLRPCNGRVNLSNIPTREPKRFGFKRPSKSMSNTRLHKRKRLGRLDLDDAYDFCAGPEFFVNLPTFGSPTPSAVPSSCSKEFCDERFAAAAAAAASATSAFDAFMVKGISTRGPGGDDDEDDEEDEASLIRMSRTPSQAPPPSPSSVYLKKRLISVKRENANLRCQLHSLLEQRNSLRKANSFLLKQNARLRNCNKRAVAAVRAAEQAVGVSRGEGHRTNRAVVLSKRPSSREPSTDQ
nr:unnamed protein product [Spirometra erinaceieuropaei]